MKSVIGILLVIIGVVFGVYAGLWWAFIGGIVDIITAARATPIVPLDIAIGVVKILFSGVIGIISSIIFIAMGAAMIE